MTDKSIIPRQPEQPGEQFHQVFASPHGGASRMLNLKHARFIALLKSRYGYTNEKAIDEMERLLKEFSASNASLKIKPPRWISTLSTAE
jgi:hypothetical protein